MEHLKSITLKIDMRIGIDISKACRELCELSKRLGVNVKTVFNGTGLIAQPNTDADWLENEYRKYRNLI